jgi:hypothetical protein
MHGGKYCGAGSLVHGPAAAEAPLQMSPGAVTLKN